MEIKITHLKSRIAELVFVFLIIFSVMYSSVTYSQESITPVQGPTMFCGDKLDLEKTLSNYKEQEFIILWGGALTAESIYYILNRNINTGSWSLIAYNIQNAPKNVACLMSGGSKSFLAPDINALENMLKKQKEGYDKPIDPNSEKTS